METITIQAVYHKGVLKPQKKLDLPEDSVVQLQVTPLPAAKKRSESLFGAFPELAAVSDEDLSWVKRQWEHGLEKQSRLLDEIE